MQMFPGSEELGNPHPVRKQIVMVSTWDWEVSTNLVKALFSILVNWQVQLGECIDNLTLLLKF